MPAAAAQHGGQRIGQPGRDRAHAEHPDGIGGRGLGRLGPPISPSTACGKPASSTAKARPKPSAITTACSTRAEASSRRPAPSARAMAETTPPPMAPADICCNSSTKGSITAQPASAAVPCRAASQGSTNWQADCTAASRVVGAARASTRRSSTGQGVAEGAGLAGPLAAVRLEGPQA